MKNCSFSVVDIEVTENKDIFQIGIINLDNKLNVEGQYNFLIQPAYKLSSFLINLTGITDEDLETKPNFSEVGEQIFSILQDRVLVCHGVTQDYAIIQHNFEKFGFSYKAKELLDTVELTKIYFPTLKSYKLSDVAEYLNIKPQGHYHQADVDALTTVKILHKIVNEINSISNNNLSHALKYLEDDYSAIIDFTIAVKESKFSVNDSFSKLTKQVHKIQEKKINAIQKNIFVSSIDEHDYIKNNLQNFNNNVVILKGKDFYLPLDFIKIFKKYSEELTNKISKINIARIIIWLEKTKTGDLSELNFDNNELLQLEIFKKYWHESKDDTFFKLAKTKALNFENIVISYSNLINVLNDHDFKNTNFVFENSAILGCEIRKLFLETFHYKHVVTELNVAIAKKDNARLKNIRENLDYVIRYLHEIYLEESIEFYNDAIDYIRQDIGLLKEDLAECYYSLKLTNQFLHILDNIIKNNNFGYYRFEILDAYHSIYLVSYNNKKEKLLFNKIQKGSYCYLKNIFKVNRSREILDIKQNIPITVEKFSSLRSLLVFSNNKHQDLYYSERDKKSNIKFKMFNINSNFSELIKDIEKNSKYGYICYASKEILNYNLYLKEIFDEIILLEK